MSDGHTEWDGHTPVGPAALIVGPGDRFLSGVSYYTALLTTASLQEAFGIGPAEALVAGPPVVASDIPAHCQFIGRAGPEALARLCEIDATDVEAASQYADAGARLLSSTDSCKERAARCTLPSAAEMVEQLLETLSAARV